MHLYEELKQLRLENARLKEERESMDSLMPTSLVNDAFTMEIWKRRPNCQIISSSRPRQLLCVGQFPAVADAAWLSVQHEP